MDNQHRKISGCRELSEAEISKINAIQQFGEDLKWIVEDFKTMPGTDQRWVAIGEIHLQQGIMALVRAVAQPTSF